MDLFGHRSAGARRRHPVEWLLTALLVLSGSRMAAADTLREVITPLDALAGTAAVVEGTVEGHTTTYDAAAGPRTVANLTGVTAHLGRYDDRTLQVAMLGGPVGGRFLFIPELPRLTDDTRYLAFLTNASWFFSPLVTDWLFRLEPGRDGSDVLIHSSGHLVLGLDANGLLLSDEPVVDTGLDFLTPHAKARLLSADPALLAAGMSKEAFLSSLRGLARSVPPQGVFAAAPQAGRVWNRLTTEAEPAQRAVSSSSTSNGTRGH